MSGSLFFKAGNTEHKIHYAIPKAPITKHMLIPSLLIIVVDRNPPATQNIDKNARL